MADKRDYYEVLGLSRDASADEIKKKRTANYRRSTTQILIRHLMPKKSLRKSMRLTRS